MFDPDTLLEIVEKIRLKSELQTEAGVRTALNRSYFSSMLKAKLRLTELGVTLSNNDEIHKEVIEKIKEKNSGMADKLNTLYDMRINADYNLEETIDDSRITSYYGIAKSFNSKVKTRII